MTGGAIVHAITASSGHATEPLAEGGASKAKAFHTLPSAQPGEFVAAQAIIRRRPIHESPGASHLLAGHERLGHVHQPEVFVFNEAFARTHFPSGALGQTIRVAKFYYQCRISRDTKY